MTVIYIVARPSPTWAVVQSLASWELGADRKFTEPRRLDVVLRGKLPPSAVPRLNQFADPERAIAISAGTQPAEHVHPVVVSDARSGDRPQERQTAKAYRGAGTRCSVAHHHGPRRRLVPMCQVDDWPLPDPRIKALIPSDRHGKTLGTVLRCFRESLQAGMGPIRSWWLTFQFNRPTRATLRSNYRQTPGVAMIPVKRAKAIYFQFTPPGSSSF